MTKARQLADLGNAYDDGALSNRNLIINGAMQVAQRGTSFISSGSGQFTLDRWISGVHTGTGDGNMTQETDAPTAAQSGTAFTHSLKFQVTTANTNIQATDRKYHVYRVEGQDLAVAGFGQAGTRYMTLSFWHKHTKTGIHSVAINNGARDRSYPMEYTQTTTNTWEKAELTFPVDTTGTWLTGNDIGAWIYFGAAFGSNYAGTANQWGTGQKYGTANQVNNYDSTSNSMQITGVQLEVGDTATPFEHRSYGDELAKCQRYYYRDNIASNDHVLSTQSNWNTTHFFGPYYMPVTMRANPTGSYSALSNFTMYQNSQTRTLTSLSFGGSQSLDSRELVSHVSSSITPQGGAGWLRGQGTGWIALDAEL